MADTWNCRPDRSVGALKIVREFTVSHNCCGEACSSAYYANALGGVPSVRGLRAVTRRDATAHLSSAGSDAQTIQQVQQDALQFEGYDVTTATLYPFKQWYGTDDLATVSRSLIGHSGGIIAEIGHAYLLPHMEQGVLYHFILLAAYDDSRLDGHFYVLNPDRVPSLGDIAGGDWMSIQQICAAGLCGMVRLLG